VGCVVSVAAVVDVVVLSAFAGDPPSSAAELTASTIASFFMTNTPNNVWRVIAIGVRCSWEKIKSAIGS
jgi:hypothetical protein